MPATWVADFGISRAIAEASMTVTGTTIGSVHYFSPEQASGEEVGPPSDIYALGIVLYEMLSGRRPFEGDSAAGVALKRLNEDRRHRPSTGSSASRPPSRRSSCGAWPATRPSATPMPRIRPGAPHLAERGGRPLPAGRRCRRRGRGRGGSTPAAESRRCTSHQGHHPGRPRPPPYIPPGTHRPTKKGSRGGSGCSPSWP